MPKLVDVKMHFGKWHDIEVEDDVTAYVEYENGATGTFITTTGDAPGTNRFEIVCDGGTLISDGGSVQLLKLDPPESVFTKENKTPFAAPHCTRIPLETDGKNEQHVGVMNAFAAAILRGEPLVADGREGVNGLTLSLARELGPKGIRVNAVAPGITETDMMRAVPTEVIDPLIAQIPLKRLGTPEDIANAFVFLASDEASYITGAVLPVDGLGRS